MPVDDSSWPKCYEHGDFLPPEKHWCEWVRDYLLSGNDSASITTGLRYAVPIVPHENLFAEVAIDTEMIGNVGAQMFLVKPELYGFDETLIPLGLWTKGEGRLIMAKVIADWQLINTPEQCSMSAHGYNEEMQVQRVIAMGPDYAAMKIYKWHLAYHGCCTFCWARSQSAADAVAASYTAAEVGLDPGTFNGATAAQNRARNALQQQYGT